MNSPRCQRVNFPWKSFSDATRCMLRRVLPIVTVLVTLIGLGQPVLAQYAVVRKSDANIFLGAKGAAITNPGNYLAFSVTNNTGTAQPDVWASLNIPLASKTYFDFGSGEDGLYRIGSMASGSSTTVYFYVRAIALIRTGTLPTATVSLYNAKPPPAVANTTSPSQSFSVIDSQDASSNKIDAIVVGPTPPVLGGIVTMTVTGDAGNLGNSPQVYFTPASLANWPADTFELFDSQISVAGTTLSNTLAFNSSTGTNPSPYTAVFKFRALKTTSAPTVTSPTTHAISGNVWKYTGTYPVSIPSMASPENLLTLAKTVNPTSLTVAPGTATYSVTFTNNATTAVALDSIVDILPSTPGTVSYVATTATFGGATIANPSIAGQQLTFTGPFNVPAKVGTVPGTVTLTYQVTIPNVNGTYKNSAVAYVGTNTIDTTVDLTDNQPAIASLAVGPVADLAITKTDNSSTYTPGSSITYVIRASNDGPSNVSAASITDTIPAAITNPTWTCQSTGTANCGSNAGSGNINLSNVQLNAGSSSNFVEITVTGTVNPAASGNLVNVATVSPPSGTSDLTAVNNSATDTDTAAPIADLSLTKTVSNAAPPVGSNVTFTLTVANAGPSNATGVSVTDLLPSGYTFVSSTAGAAYNSATGVWTVGAVNAGANISTQIVATVKASGTYANTATVTSTQSDSNTGNNSSTSTPTPSPRVDLITTKTINNAAPAVGSNVVFTLTTKNNGPSDATGVVVNDLLPGGYTFVSSTPAAAYDNGTGVWTIGNLANSATQTLTITATVKANGPYGNTATSSSTETELVPADNTQTVTPVPSPRVNLSMTKTATPANPSVGSNVTFTLTVLNQAGLNDATGLLVKDLLPSGYTYFSDNGAGAYVPATGVWTVGSVNSGSSANLQIVATVRPTGVYTNSTEVTSADQTDTNSTPNDGTGDDFATVTPGATPVADLSLTKTASSATPAVGSTVTFTVTVGNAGPSTATSVAVTDQLPSGYTFVSSNPSQGTYVPASGIWTIGNISRTSSVTLQVTATVKATGPYANTAEVTAVTETDPDSAPNNNAPLEDDQATSTPTPSPRIDLSVTKTSSPASPAVSSNVTFTVTVGNAANLNDATGVAVTDLLPSGYTLVSSNPSQGTYASGTGVWTVGTVASGSSANIQIVGTVLPNGTYANTAQVSAANETDLDSTPNDGAGDDFATATPPVTPAIDLSVMKTSSPLNPPVGSNVMFTVTVTNAANLGNATGVQVTDLLPSGYTFVSSTASQGTYVSGTGVWTVGTVNSGSSANIQIVGTVLGSGSYANSAQVTAADQTDIDSTPNDGAGDDFATNTPTPAPRINLSMTKTATPTNPSVGSNVTFTLTVSNAANLNNATGVVVRDQLPTGYTYVSDNGAGTYVPASGLWTVGAVNSGSSASLQIVATVRPTGVYTNNAEVTAADQTDTNSLPNDGTGDDFATVAPGATPIADLSLTKTASSATPAVGSDVTFTVTASNAGPSTATGVTVTDSLPSGYTFVAVTPSQGAYNTTNGVWTIGNINPASSVTLQVVATVRATGVYANTAQVTAVVETDPDSAPNNNAPLEDDQATNTPIPSPRIDLSATKTVSDAAPAVGANVTFTVTVANAANLSAATGVTLTDQLPSGYSYVSHVASIGTYAPASGLWTVGSVGSGVNVTLSIVATVRPNGIYGNTAQITAANETDINSTPNNNDGSENDQATSTPAPSPRIDLSLTKVANPANPAVGGTVTFTLTVSNAGPSIATGVQVTDSLPSGYAFGSSSPSQGSYSSVSGVWSVGTLNASGTATLTINATVLASGTYANSAQVTAANETDLDSLPNNNAPAEDDQATATPTPSPRADLRVGKTVTPANPAIGATATFTVTVGNNGPSTATGVEVTDQLPSGYTFVSFTLSQGAYNSATGVWTVGSIADAGNATLTVVGTVRSSGDYTNSAEVTSSGVIDPTSSPNDGTGDDRDSVGITPAGFSTLSGRVYADVNLNGADNSEPGIGGVSLTLTGTDISGNPVLSSATTDGSGAFSFAGLPPSDASGYTIVQTQPANYSSGATTSGTPAGVTGSNTISNIAVPANTTGTGYAFGEQRADISVVKTASSTTPAVGSTVTFTVTASNAGPTNASGVVVTDALPTGYTYISDNGAGAYLPATGFWTVENLAANGNAALTISARVNPSGSYANTAQLTSSNQADPDSTPNNNNPAEDDQSTSSLTPVATIDLSLTKTSSPATPAVGSNVTFLITVSNAANLSTASGVQVTDLLPSGYNFVSATPSSGTYNALTGLWTINTLNSGSSATLSVVAQVLATGTYANTAQVTAADQPDADSTPNDGAGDDFASDTPVPSPRADLSLSKTVSNTAPNIGSNVSFTVTLNNAGPSAATGVTVRDVLPSGFTFVSSTPSGATSYAAGTGIWTVSGIASGSSETLTIIATVGASGNYTNVAEVTGSGVTDPDSTPNDGAGDDYATSGVTPAGLSSLTGRVYADVNLSGTDNAEPGIQGVTVTLTGTDANGVPVNQTTTTDATGAYSFAGLLSPQAATTYTLTQIQPADYSGTVSNVGTGAGGVAGSNQVTGIGFPSGTIATGYSFAEQRADISVTKSASTTNPNVGTNVTFTVNVSNAGPTNATGVAVADALPTGFTLVGTPTTTAGTYAGGVWTVGALANGATQTLTITASVNASGDYTNIAQLRNSNQADPNSTPNNNNPSENDQSAAPLTPTPVADIAVSKTGPARVADGASVTYTVTVVNNGPSSANSVVVTDTLPSALSGVTVSNGGVVTSSTATWTLPTLAVGAPVSFTVTGTAPSTGTLVNLVSGSSSTLDTTPNNNDSNPANDPLGSPSSVTTQVVSAPSVTKSFAPNPIPAGGTSTLTVTLTNPNTSALTGASITDPLPSGLTPIPGTAATTCGGTVSQTTSSLTLTGGTIPAGASCTLTVQVRPSSNASGKGAQLNTIPAGALTTSESPASSAPASATLEIASIGAAKSASVPVNNNDGTYSLTYTVTLENLGSAALTNVQVVENLSATFPSPATFAIQTAPVAGADLTVNPAFNGSSDTNLLTASSSSLNLGASRTVIFTVRVTPGATPPATTFNNSVTATATAPNGLSVSDVSSNSGTDSDPNGNGNPNDPGEDSTTSVNFSENPVIGVAKQAGAPVSNGNGSYTVPFTVVVRNYGDVPLSNLTAIENLTTTFGTALLSSSVPTLAAGSASTVTPNASFSGTGANINLVGTGSSLAVGESATFNFSIVIRPTPSASSFANNVLAGASSPAGTSVTDNSANGLDPNPTPATPPTDDKAITPIVFGLITGQAFSDTNGDGAQEAGEPNLTGATVTITPNGGTPFTVTTDSAGVYRAVVPAGNTSANVSDPAGTILTTANDPQTRLVTPGMTATNTSVGFQTTAGLVGRVYTDTNGSRVQDAGETGLSGLTVTVTPIGGGAPVTATTTSSGDYIVAGLTAGQYSVNVTDPAGNVLTTANDPQTVTVAPNGAGRATPVGFQPTGTVLGRVFRDDNGNGSQGAAETGLAGVQVRITNGGFSQVVTTDANGDYTFNGLPIGTVTVDIVDGSLPVGVTQTAGTDPSAVTVLANVSNSAGADGYRLPAPVATNNTATTTQGTPVTFAITADDSATSPLTISASSIDLDPSTSNEDKTRTVAEGTYTANPDGSVTFAPNAGATGSVTPIQYTVKDSSGNLSNAATLAVTIGAATLGDVTGDVFNDANGNGVKDTGEGLSGVQVTVTSGSSTQTVTTNASGTYSALGLPVGAANVKIVTSTLPAGLIQTVGTDPSTVTVIAGANANAGLDGYRAAPPVAAADSAVTSFNTAVTFSITGNDRASSGSTINPATVDLDPSTPAEDKTLNVPEGVFTVDSLGNATFTPATGFTGTVPSINYTVKDSAGRLSNPAPISVTVGTPTTGVVRGVVYRDDNGNGVQDGSEPGFGGVSVVITPASGPVVTVVTDANGQYSAANIAFGNATVDITDSNLPAGAFATVAGADPTTITVGAGNNDAGSDGYRLARPVANNDSASTPVGTPVTFSITGNDAASNPYTIVPSSVDLDPATAGAQTSRAVPEGVYAVNGVGEVTFTPTAGFSGNATPITYTVRGSVGQTSNEATIRVVVTPTVANDAATTGLNSPVTIPVLSNDLGSLLPATVAFPSAGQPSGSSVSPDGKTLTVPGVGVYTANPGGTVTFAPANGFSGTAPNVLYGVSDGVTTRTASIAVTVTSQTVSGQVFNDLNGNGVRDAGESGTSGATVTITDSLGGTQTVTTDSSGAYTAAVPIGSTTVTVTTPTGTLLTTANNPQTLNVPAGGATAAPVGFQPKATISGVIFTDTNGDGVQQAGEPGISGAIVTITPVGGGAPVTVTTDSSGNYSAPNLPLGDYTISTGTPSNTALTTANNPQTVNVTSSGGVATPIGFKPVTSGGINGKVFNDINGNGILEAGEAGLSSATVALFEVKLDGTPDLTKPLKDAGGKPITAITDANGNYSFPSIPTGPVAIVVTNPSGKVLTTANNPQVVTVPSGASVTAAAVGYVQPKIDLTLTPDVTVVTPGDNLPYTAVITNNTPGTITPLNDPIFNVTLPKGVLFDPTKPVTVDGVVIPAGNISVKVDPTDPSRQILTIKLPNNLVNKIPQTVKFNTVVTPAVDPSKPLIAVGQVTATAGAGVTAVSVSSNAVAAAAVGINLGVFSTDTIILGRVYFDKDSNNNFSSGDVPLPGARVYLSDGRYAVTDSEGRYNITGVKPGSYAVRLDPVTAPYTPKRVPDDGGAPGTRFVNANQGGGISHEDFPLETPLAVAVKSRSTVVQRGPVTLEKAITQGGAGYAVTYTITVTKAISNLAITDPLPAGAERGPVTGATLEGNVLRFIGITQPGTYTVTFALFSAAPPDLILTDPEIVYMEIFTLIPSSPNSPAASGGSTKSQEVKR